MRILSLFDGMACGYIAMQNAGVEIESYDAYEIDKYAIETATHNFPDIVEHGDVFNADFTQYAGVDFLIGGSPCTHWSIAQTQNRETTVSRDEKGQILLHSSGIGFELFSQYLRALDEAKPKFFIYENNKSMSKEIRAAITECFGFEPVCINSALVSAQNRQRLYWVGIRNADGAYSKVHVEQPEDRGILLKDVLDSAVAWREKAYTIDANYYKATDGTDPFGGHQSNNRMMAAEPVNVTADGKSQTWKAQYIKNNVENFCCYTSTYGASGVAEPLVATKDGKSFAITANYVNIQEFPNDYAAHTIEKSVKPLVAEPIQVGAVGNMYGKGQNGQLFSLESKTKTLSSGQGNAGRGIGSNNAPKVILPVGVRQVGRRVGEDGHRHDYDESIEHEQRFEVNEDPQKTNCISTVAKDSMVAEPVCLRYERTEEAKRCRKAYERHEIKHGYNELNELHPRPDGKTNTLTTVQKDNQIMEPVCVAQRGRMYIGQEQHFEARDDGKTNTLTSVEKDNRVAEPICVNSKSGRAGVDGLQPSIADRIYEINGKGTAVTTAFHPNIAEPIQVGAMPRPNGELSTSAGFRVYSTDAKGRYLCANGGGAGAKTGLYAIPYVIEFDSDGKPIKAIGKNGKEITIYEVRDGKITIKGKQYPIKLVDGYYIIRKLTVSECKRLQTVPEWYEFPVSDSQAYKMLGNGWTCDVITHLIQSVFNEVLL